MLVMLSKRSAGYAAFNRATFVREHGLGDAEAEALDAIVVLVGGYSDEVAWPEGESVPGLMRPPAQTGNDPTTSASACRRSASFDHIEYRSVMAALEWPSCCCNQKRSPPASSTSRA